MSDKTLILQVQSFPALFDKKDARFKNKIAKENAWKTIAAILETDPASCEQRWITLRARYTNIKKRMRDLPSGSGATEVTWPYYTLMKFLDPFLATRRTISNVNVVPEVNSWDTLVQLMEGSEEEALSPTVPTTPLPSPSLSLSSLDEPSTSGRASRQSAPPAKKKKSGQEELMAMMTACFSKLDNQMKKTEDEEFAISLAKDMAVLTNEEKIFFKRDVYNLLGKIVEKRNQ